MINLNFPQPVHDISNFFNHGQELKKAQDALRSGSKRLVIVVGEREIGKTSFQNVTMEWLRELNQPPYLVDIPMIGNIQTVDELALEILQGLFLATGQTFADMGFVQPEQLQTLTDPDIFRQMMLKGLPDPSQPIVIRIDEFDTILNPGHISQENIHKILSLVRHLVVAWKDIHVSLFLSMTYIPTPTEPAFWSAISGNTRVELFSIIGQLLQHAELIPLQPFDLDGVRNLVEGIFQGKAHLDGDALAELYSMGGGHPYVTKLILHNLVGLYGVERMEIVTANMVRHAVGEALQDRRMAFVFANIYQVHFTEDQKRVMLLLADRHKAISSGELLSHGENTVRAAEELTRRGYLQRNQQQWSVRAHFLHQWLGQWDLFKLELEKHNPGSQSTSRFDEGQHQ